MNRRLNIVDSKPQWRSIEERAGEHDEQLAETESPNGARAWEQTEGLSRRGFMGAAGTTLAATSALLTGCIRKPVENIVPLADRPEDRIPGAPLYYNTAARIGGTVMGLRVTSQDGRPTKVDGNPDHPANDGGANAFAQASIMELYDPDRLHAPTKGGAEGTWEEFQTWAKTAFGSGKKVAVLVEENQSPSLGKALEALGARVFVHDMGRANNAIAGAALSGMAGWRAWLDLSKAAVIASFDSDFLGVEGDVVRNTKNYARSRKVVGDKADLSRLYMVEPNFTNTGANADNRLRLKPSQVGPFLAAVAKKVFAGGVATPKGADVSGLKADDAGQAAFADALAKDLVKNRGRGAVLVGESQPAWVHALGNMLNGALGNVGATVHWIPSPATTDTAEGVDALAAAIKGRQVDSLLILGGNPALTAPAGLGFGELIGTVANSAHLTLRADETSAHTTWTLPVSHFLESWGDHVASDGTYAIQQPLIAPLFGTWSPLQLVHFLAEGKVVSGNELVKASAKARGTKGEAFDKAWNRWLHDGHSGAPERFDAPLAQGAPAPADVAEADGVEPTEGATGDGSSEDGAAMAEAVVAPTPAKPTARWDWSKFGAAASKAKAGSGFEVAFALCPKLFDGRFANLAWLQELPDPVTKLSWDNALLLSPATASAKGLKRGDIVSVTVEGRSVDAGVFVLPGVADDTGIFTVGHGRGKVGGRFAAADWNDYTVPAGGFNAYAIKGADWFASAEVSGAKGEYHFVTTQEHGRLDPTVETPFGAVHYDRRPLVHEATVEEFAAEPTFAQEKPLFPLESLFEPPVSYEHGHQWGMTIDLTTCVGCNACTIACQAENNIQVAGKDRVAVGRELHWIRLDRYFTGEDENNPEAVFQPIGCQHCETAPCETVCPVGATSHSPDGLNDMAYNRCIGTRYCANNCPFKVRRFNFFNFSRENHEANTLLQMQQNQNVTVRFRGVIEKCTYCTQRVQKAKIAAKRSSPDGKIADGAIVPACAETCPADAITFGDINDPNTAVSKMKASPRNYALLQDLNIHPRTTFLAKLRNPNPELA